MKRELTTGIIMNIVLIVLGLLFIIVPDVGISVILSILAIGMLAIGLFRIVAAIVHKANGQSEFGNLVISIVILLLGVLVLIFRQALGSALSVIIPVIIGIWTLYYCAIFVIRAFKLKEVGAGSWWVSLAIAVPYLVFGIIVVFNFSALTTLIGAFFLIMGAIGLLGTGTASFYSNKYTL